MSTPEGQNPRRLGRALRVLYVEDSPREAKLHCKQLERAGFEVTADVVATPEEFAGSLQAKTYDIVLADCKLPSWSGIEALEMLNQTGKDIPFILITGTVGEEAAVDCLKKGATDYVLKDRPARLSLAVQRALDERVDREERRRAERSRDHLASIVESSQDAIIGISLDAAIASWNAGAAQIYGYLAEEIRGKPVSILFAPEDIDTLNQAIEALRRGGSISRYESKGVRKTGDLIDVALTMSPIREEGGGIAGAAAIARDITDHKQLQRELFLAQKMEAIGRLAAGVAHDFNNLLTVVTGYSAIVLGQLKEQDPLRQEVREIGRAGERAASLTRQLLAFSRNQILQPRVLDLNVIVTEMDRMLRRLIGEDIELTAALDSGLKWVKADPGQIEQIIMNLAVNARDAMPKGGKLTIETANVDLEKEFAERHIPVPPGPYVMLAVTDTGIGMNGETQARIFEPFFTTKAQGQGTGLGLATVYGIVEQCGGAILVYSEVDHGTVFKIYLPGVQGAPVIPEAAPVAAPQRGSETVLVVEDEDAVRGLVCRILHARGYTVLAARNGGEALLLCEQQSREINLMITDVVMPAMSGSELAQRLAPLHPEMKVLFMSGYTDGAIVHHGVLDPQTAFLNKPFTPSGLAAKVREVLGAGK
ncbi:MAG: response regulator [Bryobacteraceae bacterium]